MKGFSAAAADDDQKIGFGRPRRRHVATPPVTDFHCGHTLAFSSYNLTNFGNKILNQF